MLSVGLGPTVASIYEHYAVQVMSLAKDYRES